MLLIQRLVRLRWRIFSLTYIISQNKTQFEMNDCVLLLIWIYSEWYHLLCLLVILAILALIVTPLVMNIIRKARISVDKRSIEAYGRSIELAIASYLMDNGDFPTSIDELTMNIQETK